MNPESEQDYDNFYVILNSDKNHEFPKNTPCDFTTRLSNKINLEGVWNVGLTSIHLPFSWDNTENVQDPYIRIFHSSATSYDLKSPVNDSGHVTDSRRYVDINISSIDLYDPHLITKLTHYISDCMREIHNHNETEVGNFDNIGSNGLQFQYSVLQSKNCINLSYAAIKIPKNLAWVLGFVKNVFVANEDYPKRTIIWANSNPHYSAHLNYCYIYSNIVARTHISNQKNNILRILANDSSFGHVITKDFTNTMYLKCNSSKIEIIHIEICNDQGEILKAKFGRTLLTLHFTRKYL